MSTAKKNQLAEDGGMKIRTVNGYETWGPEQKK